MDVKNYIYTARAMHSRLTLKLMELMNLKLNLYFFSLSFIRDDILIDIGYFFNLNISITGWFCIIIDDNSGAGFSRIMTDIFFHKSSDNRALVEC